MHDRRGRDRQPRFGRGVEHGDAHRRRQFVGVAPGVAPDAVGPGIGEHHAVRLPHQRDRIGKIRHVGDPALRGSSVKGARVRTSAGPLCRPSWRCGRIRGRAACSGRSPAARSAPTIRRRRTAAGGSCRWRRPIPPPQYRRPDAPARARAVPRAAHAQSRDSSSAAIARSRVASAASTPTISVIATSNLDQREAGFAVARLFARPFIAAASGAAARSRCSRLFPAAVPR